MVKCIFYKINNYYSNVEIQGHVFREITENNLICAGISSIVFGSLNALEELESVKNYKIGIEKNKIFIKISKYSKTTNNIIKVLLIQLKTIELKYPNDLKIIIRN